jgi:hypothetical protein
VLERVTKVKMTFFIVMEWEIGLSGESGRHRCYGFNTSVSVREGSRWDKALSEDEAETISSS